MKYYFPTGRRNQGEGDMGECVAYTGDADNA